MKFATFVTLLAASLALAGCVTPRENFAQRERSIRAVNTNSRATLAAGEAVAADDPDRVKPVEILVSTQEQENAAIATAVDARLAKLESFKKELLQTLTAVAKTAVPGAGAALTTIAGKIDEATTSVGTVGQKQIEQAKVLDALKGKLTELQTAQTGMEQKLAEKEKALGELKASVKEASDQLVKKFGALPTEQKESVKLAILEELEKSGVSKADLEKFKGMTPEQLVGMAGGGGLVGLAALAGLFRTLGPSRGKKEIDELWEQSSALKAQLEKLNALTDETKDLRAAKERLAALISALEARIAGMDKK